MDEKLVWSVGTSSADDCRNSRPACRTTESPEDNMNVLRWVSALILLVAVGCAVTLRDRSDPAALQAWVEGAGEIKPAIGALSEIMGACVACHSGYRLQ